MCLDGRARRGEGSGEFMATASLTARIRVVADDELRAERLTRSLAQELDRIAGVAVKYEAVAAATTPGAKGASSDLLTAVLDIAWPVAAPLVAEKVKDWRRERKRETVRVTVGDDYVELSGEPTAEQARLLAALLDDRPR